MCLVISRGKGDYHRLGHGSDDHVRRPRQVQGLQGKKVIAIATGSLHCVCCTEDGKTDNFMYILLFFFTCSVYFRYYFSSYRLCHLASWYQSPNSSAKTGWAAVSRKAFLLCLAQEKCTHGATTMRASLETGPQMPSRGRDWWQRCRARKSTGWPVALLTPSPGPPASPPTLGNCLHRYRTDLSLSTCSSRWQ